jgi:hypothetical protein
VGVAALFERVARDPVLAIDFGPAECSGKIDGCGTVVPRDFIIDELPNARAAAGWTDREQQSRAWRRRRGRSISAPSERL